MKLAPGITVDRYQVERLVGAGGMAEVWQVRHKLLGSRHALKVLTYASETMQRRLLQEGRAQARLDHPNLLPVRDVLLVAGRPALLMPLIEGPSLDKLLAIHRLNRAGALALLKDIVEGLGHAHRQGFVHRDLKPANVLIEVKHGRVWPRIADFGLVKDTSHDRTRTGEIFGTPAYAAPEQLYDASGVDARSDLFSLGVMATRMLLGRRPFDGVTIGEIRAAHQRPPNLDGLDPLWRERIGALLATDPAGRPASCAVVRGWLADTPLSPLMTGGRLMVAVQRQQHPVDAQMDPAATARTDTSEDLPTSETWSGEEMSSFLASLDLSPPNNLISSRNLFFGRTREIREISALLANGQRLVTLLGMGGIGKTRLAIELGRSQLENWPGGVWLCDLSEARSLPEVLLAVARALDIPLDHSPASQLANSIMNRGQALFLLDNFEQVAHLATQTVGRWLDRAPKAHFLVTSREPLRLKGESLYFVGVLEEEASIALFVERAQKVNQRFSLAEDNREDVRDLVRLLDCLPLAIELAAARNRMFSPKKLLSRMSRRFDVLKSRSTDLPARQRTLRATLAWSWELLDAEEQSVLARCSLFEGGITLEAAEAVIAVEDAWVDEVLAELVDKSWLIRGEGRDSGDTRLSMLVTVQEFAAEKLTARGEVEERYGAYFARFGTAEAVAALRQRGGVARGWRLREELKNLVAATHHALDRQDATIAAPCALAAAEGFALSGPFLEGVALIDRVEQSLTLPPRSRALLLRAGGELCFFASQNAAAAERLQQALELATALGEPGLIAACQGMLGIVVQRIGQVEAARAAFEAALAIARSTPDRQQEGTWVGALAILDYEQGEMNAARIGYERALAITREVGDRRQEGRWLGRLGGIHNEQSRPADARPAYEAALAIAREVGDRRREGFWLDHLGMILALTGDFDLAERVCLEALKTARELGERVMEANILGNMSNLCRDRGRPDEARRLLESALAIAQEVGDRRREGIWLGNLAIFHQERGALDAARQAYEQGLAIAEEVGDQAGVGFLHANLGVLHREQGRLEAAQASLEVALSIAERLGDRANAGVRKGTLGLMYLQQDQPERARSALLGAQAIARALGQRFNEGIWAGNLGLFHRAQGEHAAAEASLQEALTIAREMENARMEGVWLSALGQLALDKGDLAEAENALEAGRVHLRAFGDQHQLGIAEGYMALVAVEAGNPEAAEAALARASAIAEALKVGPGSELGQVVARAAAALKR